MSGSDLAFGLGLFVGAIVVFLSWWTMGTLDADWRPKAVERGAAEWVVDQKTGSTTFKWKPPTSSQP